jgi:hypothetical protein
MYRDTYDEAQRIIRISDEVRVSLQKIDKPKVAPTVDEAAADTDDGKHAKVTSSKLAFKLQLKTPGFIALLILKGYVEEVDDQQVLTKAGALAGGEAKTGRFGAYFIWPENFNPS